MTYLIVATVNDLAARLARLERHVAHHTPTGHLVAERTGLGDGFGVRVAWGVLSDGNYGFEMFSRAGTRTVIASTPP